MTLVALAACESAPAPPTAFAVRDSAGIRIVESSLLDDLPTVRHADPELQIGWAEGEPAFERVNAGVLLPNGGAVVADRQGDRLYLIDVDGSATQVGRDGEGPGEFRSIGAVELLPGRRLAVWDAGLNRLSSFSIDGEFLEGARIPSNGSVYLTPFGVMGEKALGLLPTSLALEQGTAQSYWATGPLVRYDLTTLAYDTVREVPFVLIEMDGEFPSANPFTSFGAGDVFDGGFVWATSDGPDLRWIDQDGLVTQIARWNSTPIEVSDDVWERYEAVRLNALGSTPDPAREQRTVELLQKQRAAASNHLPHFRFVHATPEGDVWLSDYTLSTNYPSRFLVVSRSGQPESWIEFETPTRILDIQGDHVLGIQEDEWGTQAIVIYPT